MSRGYNKVILMGNLTRDPEVRHTTSKQKVAKFTVAVGRQWKNKQTGKTETQTDFLPVVVWGPLADVADRYLSKGKPVLVEGRLQVRDYEDTKTKTRRWVTEIIVSEIKLLPDGKRGEGQERPQQSGESGEFEDDFPLDFASLGDDSRGPADTPF